MSVTSSTSASRLHATYSSTPATEAASPSSNHSSFVQPSRREPEPTSISELYGYDGQMDKVVRTIRSIAWKIERSNDQIPIVEDESECREEMGQLEAEYALLSSQAKQLFQKNPEKALQQMVENDLKKFQGRIGELKGALDLFPSLRAQKEKMEALEKEIHELKNPTYEQLQKFKERVVSVVVDPALHSTLRQKSIRLVENISSVIEDFARELSYKLADLRDEAEYAEMFCVCSESLSKIGVTESAIKEKIEKEYSALPKEIQGKIEGEIWRLAHKPNTPEFGKKNLFTDYSRLAQAISSLDEFPKDPMQKLRRLIRLIAIFQEKPFFDLKTHEEAALKNLNMQRITRELSELPANDLGKIYGHVYHLAVAANPQAKITDPEFGKNNALKDLPRLREAVNKVMDEYFGIQRRDTQAEQGEEQERVSTSASRTESAREEKDSEDEEKTSVSQEPVYTSASRSGPAPRSVFSAFEQLLEDKHEEVEKTYELFDRLVWEKYHQLTNDQKLPKEQVNAVYVECLEKNLDQRICNDLYGKLYKWAGNPQTQDPQWGRNNVAASYESLEFLVKCLSSYITE